MKKLFLFSVAALAFCACSSDETVSEKTAANQQPKQISFTPLNKVNTRAAVHGTTFPDQDMYVAAYMAAPNAGNYFEKTALRRTTKVEQLQHLTVFGVALLPVIGP